MFKVTYSGTILNFILPTLGCSPLPLKIPGGSILALATFYSSWSIKQY